jgi:hypothetical protein
MERSRQHSGRPRGDCALAARCPLRCKSACPDRLAGLSSPSPPLYRSCQLPTKYHPGSLDHLPSRNLTTNAAWLVLAVIAFNLTRAAASTTSSPSLDKATTATIRRKPITVPARIASSTRRLKLHPPASWPWKDAWTDLVTQTCGPPQAATPDHPPATAPPRTPRNTPITRPGNQPRPLSRLATTTTSAPFGKVNS